MKSRDARPSDVLSYWECLFLQVWPENNGKSESLMWVQKKIGCFLLVCGESRLVRSHFLFKWVYWWYIFLRGESGKWAGGNGKLAQAAWWSWGERSMWWWHYKVAELKLEVIITMKVVVLVVVVTECWWKNGLEQENMHRDEYPKDTPPLFPSHSFSDISPPSPY